MGVGFQSFEVRSPGDRLDNNVNMLNTTVHLKMAKMLNTVCFSSQFKSKEKMQGSGQLRVMKGQH